MTDARDDGTAVAGPQIDSASLIEAAQKAVNDGHYSEAERLLREAAVIQETTLGEFHPDLATTLNNLAYVCEQTGHIDEAERGYRRAHKIAVASLSPRHPFIKTSLSNLMEFCEARGIPIWTRPETPVEDEPLPDEIDVATSLDVATSSDVAADDDLDEPRAIEVSPEIIREPAVASRLPLRMMAAAALVIVAVAVIAFARQGWTEKLGAGLALAPGPGPEARPGPSPGASPRATEPTVAPAPRPAPMKANASVTVLKAQLCRALVKRGSPDWQCTRVRATSAGADGPPGRYTFYTRLLTTAGTTVQHRWYFRGRVHQTMRLRVSANPGSGYRTLSTTTVSPERAGEWKVELRAADGTVLDEARFVVR